MPRYHYDLYIDLDETPGTILHSKESAQNAIRFVINSVFPNANVLVSLAEEHRTIVHCQMCIHERPHDPEECVDVTNQQVHLPQGETSPTSD